MLQLTQITPSSYMAKAVDSALQVRFLAILRKVAWIAEQAVNEQRNLPSPPVEMRKGPHQPNYIDDTGNLRNNIGYLLAFDGKPFSVNMLSEKSREIASKALSGKYGKGITLILTAGMEYAEWVQGYGYDVLTTAELFCKKALKEMCDKYKGK